MNAILYGDAEPLMVNFSEFSSLGGTQLTQWSGLSEWIMRNVDEESKRGQKWREQFLVMQPCEVCGGSRLKAEALQFRIGGKSIADVSAMSIQEFSEWMSTIEEHLSDKEQTIARDIIKEIRERLGFLVAVGLGYLSLSRASRTISGGESQRIRLATQIGSKLVNVLYILDGNSSLIRSKMMTLASTAIPIVSTIPAIPGSVNTAPNDTSTPIRSNTLNKRAMFAIIPAAL